MYSLAFLTVVSVISALLLTPVVRNVFLHFNVLDRPNIRKVHDHAIPRVGGVAIALAYLVAFGSLLIAGSQGGHIVWAARAAISRLVPAALFIFAVGLLDDLRTLSPWTKLTGQIAAASLAYAAGVHVRGFSGLNISEPWNFFVTVGWLLLCTNAVNLIDGIDGLAAGVGLFASVTTLIAALLQGNVELALATTPLAGALLGFLRFNFNPATIFLGDSGSLLVGFLLGCFGVLWSQKSATILGMTAPLMALSIPLIDTTLAIARRFIRRQPIFGADRGHIHHRLLDRGLTPRKAALVLYACCAAGAICSLAMMNQRLHGSVIVIFCAATWIGIQHLGYIEFGLAGRMVVEGAFRRQLNAQLALLAMRLDLDRAESRDQCWSLVQKAARDFGFHRVHMEVGGFIFDHREPIEPVKSWTIHVPINESDYIELSRPFDVLGNATALAPFADMLSTTLAQKLPLFSTPAALRATASGHD